LQSEAEQLLGKAAAGDAGAADRCSAGARWTGKRIAPEIEQSIETALNLPDLHSRQAAGRDWRWMV
jgi:hypothetical protein